MFDSLNNYLYSDSCKVIEIADDLTSTIVKACIVF